MFDPDDRTGTDYPDADLFRAAVPGWSSALRSRARPGGNELLAPGRKWLEVCVGLSAFAIVVPALILAAVPCALRARALYNRRWLAAVMAACWCGLLGVLFRGWLGVGLFP
jgi:hypothetical protein